MEKAVENRLSTQATIDTTGIIDLKSTFMSNN